MRPPTRRPAMVSLLAWGSCALFVGLWLLTVLLVLVGDAAADQVITGFALGYALTGALVAVREPGNSVGWLLLAIALSFGFQGLVDAYVTDPGRPGAAWAAWVASSVWYLWLYCAAVLLPLVFPDGRLISRRWRPALWLAGIALACSVASESLMPGPLGVDADVVVINPLGIDGAGPLLSRLGFLGDVLVTVGFGLAVASLVLRLRRSQGRQRQQVKWFAYAGSLALVCVLLAMLEVFTEQVVGPRTTGWINLLGTVGWFGTLFFVVLGIPTAVGVAILRHRLYGIDLVVKRTIVYGSLTVTLAAVYLGSVLTLRVLLAPVAGTSDLAVAASTLAVAALFRPARSRIQRGVDRRFDRRKYDAVRTVQSFAGRLRHEVDLHAVTGDLEVVVRDTVQPTHVSLWLRSAR